MIVFTRSLRRRRARALTVGCMLAMAAGSALIAVQFQLDAAAETMMPIAADDERAMERL